MLVGAILLFSCHSEEGENDWFNRITDSNYTLKAQIESSANTRTMVDEENRIVWTKNDQIGVYGDKETTNACFTYSHTAEEGTSAEFRGELKEEETPIFAYYPYDEDAQMSGNQLKFTLPTEYDYDESCRTPMIGVKQDDGDFSFKHLCGVLRFMVEDLPTDVTKLVITSSGDAAPGIAGLAVVDDVQKENIFCVMDASQSYNSLTIHLSSNEVKSYNFCIPLPVGEYPLLTITFYLSDGSEYFSNSIHSCLIRRATILNLGDPSIKKNGNFLVSDMEGYDGMLIANDHSLWMYKENEETGITERMYIAMPSVVETGVIESAITLNEQGLPDAIATKDFSIKFLNYENNSFDIYVITDDLIYCIKDIETEEPITTNVATKGVIEERAKLERNKKILNTLRIALKGVKVVHSLWEFKEDLAGIPSNIYSYWTKNTINTYGLIQVKNDLDEYYNSFDNFVSNKVEYKDTDVQNITSAVLTSSGKEIIDWLSLEVKAIEALKKEGVSVFLEVLDDALDELENSLYEQEQAIIEWEALDKSNLAVITEEAGAVSYTSVTLNGRIKGAYELDDKCGFIYSDGSTNEVQSAQIRELISTELTGLQPGTTYYYNAFYTPARYQFTLVGEQKSFTTKECSVVTGGIGDKTPTSVTAYGKEMGGWEAHQILLDLGICYSSTNSQPTLENCEGHVYAPKGTSGEFTVQLSDLQPNTRYYYRAFMRVDDYPVFYGETTYFMTPADTDGIKVSTLQAEDITENSVVLYGNISGWDKSMQGVLGFFYSDTDQNPQRGGTNVKQLSSGTSGFIVKDGEIPYKGTLNDLEPGTTYYYRAFVYVNEVEEPILGDVKSFTTQSVDLRVQTGGVSDITTNSAIVHGTVTNCPPFQINIGFHFYYESTESHKISAKFESEYDLQTRKMTYLGRMSNLTPGTTYKYYAYASVVGMSETYCEGSWKQFTTKGQNPDTKSSVENVIQDHSMEFICKDYVRQIEWNQIQKSEY